MAYASPTDLIGLVAQVPENAELLLTRASRNVDRALLSAVYDPTDPVVIEALRQATIEQVLGGLEDGDKTGLGSRPGRPAGFAIGKISVQQGNAAAATVKRTGDLVSQAFAVLQAAGLTGHQPWTG